MLSIKFAYLPRADRVRGARLQVPEDIVIDIYHAGRARKNILSNTSNRIDQMLQTLRQDVKCREILGRVPIIVRRHATLVREPELDARYRTTRIPQGYFDAARLTVCCSDSRNIAPGICGGKSLPCPIAHFEVCRNSPTGTLARLGRSNSRHHCMWLQRSN